MRKIIFMTFCFFFLVNGIKAQKEKEKEDLKTDTLRIYHSIERFAKKKRFTHQLYKAVFNLPDTTKKKKITRNQGKVDYYERYGGRIIRNIIIQTLDPFGYKARDTAAIPRSFIQKGGNFLHNRSSAFT